MSTEPTTLETEPARAGERLSRRAIALILLPVVVLAGVIALFAATKSAGLDTTTEIQESLAFESTTFQPGLIAITVRNTGPRPVTISAVNIDDAIWPFHANPSPTIPRLAETTIRLSYPWVDGEPYHLTVFTSNSQAFSLDVDAAEARAVPGLGTLLSYVLIGLYMGVIPVGLGMAWLPAARRLGPRWLTFLMAVSAGLLIFLGIDALAEAIALVGDLGSPWQGFGLAWVGLAAAFLLREAISREDLAGGRWSPALLIAAGIGLQNFGAGLAVGAAYSQAEPALGTLLVIGFLILNLVEGLEIAGPAAGDRLPLPRLALLGLIGGGPAILGGLIGGLIFSSVLAILFLAVSAGAAFAAVVDIARRAWHDPVRPPAPLVVFGGVMAGLLSLYLIGLLVR